MGVYGEIQPDGTYSIQRLYHLNGNANDDSGNGDTGSVSGATSVNTGQFGQAYDFNGSSDYIETAYYPSAAPASASVWVKFSSVTGNRLFLGTHDEDNHRFYIGIKDTRYFFAAGNSYKGWSSGVSHNFSTGTWYYIVLVLDGSTAHYYVDGAEVDSFSYSFSGTSTDWLPIGANRNNGSFQYYFYGTLDEVVIYNRALSATEIRRIYAMQKGMFGIVN
jgi:hypothetical protein